MTHLQALTYARSKGVSPSSFHVLLAALTDSPITVSRISEMTGIKLSGVTGACDRLAEAEWVERNSNPKDRRSWLIVPSEEAFEQFSQFVVDGTPEKGEEVPEFQP